MDFIDKPYLRDLENTLERNHNITVITRRQRYVICDWLITVTRMLKLGKYVMGLTMTLMDSYFSVIANIEINQLQLICCVCAHIASSLLQSFPPEISDYIYIADGNFSREEFISVEFDVINKLDGIFILPSTVFFVNMHNIMIRELTIISYVIPELVLCKPSLIAQSINYLLNGKYELYILDQIYMPIKLIIKTINKLIQGKNSELKLIATNAQKNINFTCPEKITLISKPITNTIIKKSHICNNNYEKIDIIGKGISGLVYKIKNNNSFFVLKTILFHNDDENISKGITEIAILQKLIQYPNIVNLCGFDILLDKVEIYLSYGGITLEECLKKDILDRNNLYKYFSDIITGLHYCHYNDIIHNDIKLTNIVYDKEKMIIIDFGNAISYTSHQQIRSEIASTFIYRAPEALLDDTQCDHKIDIWAMGVTFYFMVTNPYLIHNPHDPEYVDILIKLFGKNAILEKEFINMIFKVFGTPNKETWSGIKSMKKLNKYPIYPPDTNLLMKKLGSYYDFVMHCLILDPQQRADTNLLLELFKYK